MGADDNLHISIKQPDANVSHFFRGNQRIRILPQEVVVLSFGLQCYHGLVDNLKGGWGCKLFFLRRSDDL